MPFPFPNIDLDEKKNHTATGTGLSSGYTVIGVTTIDSTLGWDTLTKSGTQSESKMSTSNEPLTVTMTALPPISKRPVDEPDVVTSIIMSTITHDHTSTVTVGPDTELEPLSTIWISNLSPPTSITQPLPTTSTATPSPKSYLSTVELVGVVIGIICLLTMICLPILFILRRRRRNPPASDSQNNINIRVGNGSCSRWSHSDDSRPTPLPLPQHTEENKVKTEFVKRPFRVMSPPPRYNDYWKGQNEEYEMGVRDTVGEASGSRFAEQHYSDPKGKGKQRADGWI
ncbi:hypothetical protein FLONG3_4378 [Fusarium longipes]|uniref:Uncharacterized protein n=1 Tax=Fusarium longipes TaxID=694270 RepID=A0A395SZA5_9HYPO|nr:hypothetical protein FLONG3_4378 [Fusarium longipes]